MNALVAYASNSGNTKQVAERVAAVLAKHKWEVTVSDVAQMTPGDLAGYDLIVLGSCTWERHTEAGRLEGQLPEHMHRFAELVAGRPPKLDSDRFAVFGLGRHEYTAFCGAVNHLKVLVGRLGGELVVDPLKIDGFPQHQGVLIDDWAERLAMTATQPVG